MDNFRIVYICRRFSFKIGIFGKSDKAIWVEISIQRWLSVEAIRLNYVLHVSILIKPLTTPWAKVQEHLITTNVSRFQQLEPKN